MASEFVLIACRPWLGRLDAPTLVVQLPNPGRPATGLALPCSSHTWTLDPRMFSPLSGADPPLSRQTQHGFLCREGAAATGSSFTQHLSATQEAFPSATPGPRKGPSHANGGLMDPFADLPSKGVPNRLPRPIPSATPSNHAHLKKQTTTSKTASSIHTECCEWV